MFETTWIIWLQQGPQWLLPFMTVVSTLGNDFIYMPLILFLIFFCKVRLGLQVMLALALVGVMIGTTKEGFALPRPADIDVQVLDKGKQNFPLVADGAAKSFWALPDADAIATVRQAKRDSYGFISGHTANAVVLALAILLFCGVRSRWLWALGLLWPVLTLLSRMYLGRHFLADILGGIVAGLLAIALTMVLSRQLLATKAHYLPGALLMLCCGVCIMLATTLDWLSPSAFGAVIGTLLCLIGSQKYHFIQADVSHWQRPLRLLLAFGWVVAVQYLLDNLYLTTGLPDTHLLSAGFAAVGYPLAILGALWLCRLCRLSATPQRAI